MNKYRTGNIQERSYYSTKNVILRELGSNKIILDVGCNDGYFGKFDRDNIYYGLDYQEDALNEAKKYYKETELYDLSNLKKLSWNIKFDRIIFADVLEHIINPEAALKYFCQNYLKENGIVILSFPNIANWQVRLNLLFGNFNYTDTGIMDKTHLHFYTFKTVRNLVINCHLEIISELFGTKFFGKIIQRLLFLKNLFSTNIIITATYNNYQ